MPFQRSLLTLCFVTLFLNTVSTGREAAAQRGVEQLLAGARSLKCTFPLYAIGTWTAGEPQAEIRMTPISLAFDMINTDEGTARASAGFAGNFDIIVRLSGSALHLIQAFRDGPLYSTTVFARESHDGRLRAVHTRHEFTEISLPGFTSRPEQHYGDCEIGR